MTLFYQCTEEQMRRLDFLDAHLHVLMSLAVCIDAKYPLDISPEKLSTMLSTLSNDLTDTLASIKSNDCQAQKNDREDSLKKAFAAIDSRRGVKP